MVDTMKIFGPRGEPVHPDLLSAFEKLQTITDELYTSLFDADMTLTEAKAVQAYLMDSIGNSAFFKIVKRALEKHD